MRGEIDFVDDQQIRAGHARSTFTRNLVAARYVDHVDRRVHELRAEARREVVAAALEEHDIEGGMTRGELVQRIEIHRRVFANRGVGTPARLHADDPVGRQRLTADEKLHVLAREDIVGDHAEAIAIPHRLAERVDECGFPGSDRTADPDADGRVLCIHGELRAPCVVVQSTAARVQAL